jgi:hypothetical protein
MAAAIIEATQAARKAGCEEWLRDQAAAEFETAVSWAEENRRLARCKTCVPARSNASGRPGRHAGGE